MNDQPGNNANMPAWLSVARQNNTTPAQQGPVSPQPQQPKSQQLKPNPQPETPQQQQQQSQPQPAPTQPDLSPCLNRCLSRKTH